MDGDTYKLKINNDNGKFFVRDVSGGRRLCAMHVVKPSDLASFAICVAAEIGGDASNRFKSSVQGAM
mgnify:CR=1 FL=1